MLASTLYLGFHYFPDLVAGWVLGVLAYLAAPWCERKPGELDSLVFAWNGADGEAGPESGPADPLGPAPMDLP